VYVPARFKPDDAQLRKPLANHGAADRITAASRGLLATMLPFVYDRLGSRPDAGEHGVLLGHVARHDHEWREPAIGEAPVSQDRSAEDVDGAIAGQDPRGDPATAAAMRALRARVR